MPGAQTQLGDHRFTNNKVIAAKVFYNKAANQGAWTPEAIESHGTHVAGTVACNFETPARWPARTSTTTRPAWRPPRCWATTTSFRAIFANARSEDILNALDAAYADGFDVANMSLGGGPGKTRTSPGRRIYAMPSTRPGRHDLGSRCRERRSGRSRSGAGSGAASVTAGAVTVGHYIGVDADKRHGRRDVMRLLSGTSARRPTPRWCSPPPARRDGGSTRGRSRSTRGVARSR